MHDLDTFETRFTSAVRLYTADDPRHVDASALARTIATDARARRPAGLLARLGLHPLTTAPKVLLTAGLVLLLAAGTAIVGSQLLKPGPRAPSPSLGPGGFVPTGPMAEARAELTATALLDGRLLVIGGRDYNAPDTTLATAEVWDPTTGAFGPAGSMAQRRVGQTATLLADGRVLVIGGTDWNLGTGAFAEIWDPVSRTFARSGSLLQPRQGHAATLLRDGRVLVIGGNDVHGAVLASAELWDPATMAFTPAGHLAVARTGATATLMEDGDVLVIGGRAGDEGAAVASAELWDPGQRSFSVAGSLLEARYAHTATLLEDGRILVVGGRAAGDDASPGGTVSAEIWDPETGAFRATGAPAVVHAFHTATLLRDGRVLVVGGNGEYGLAGRHTGIAVAELFDPVSETFAPAGSPAHGYSVHGAALLPDGRVLVVGAYKSSERTLCPDGTARTATNRCRGATTIVEFSPASELFDPGGGTADR